MIAWERELGCVVAVHDVIVAGDRLLGRVSAQYEPARLAVVDVIDRALAAGVPEQTIDAALQRLRADAERTSPHTTEAGSSTRPRVHNGPSLTKERGCPTTSRRSDNADGTSSP